MEPPLPRVVLLRLLLVAVPFAIWFIWRAWARRSGREMGSTPYPWLFAAGAVLVGLSLIGAVGFHPDNRAERHVPREGPPGGRVTPGPVEDAPPPRVARPAAHAPR